MSFFLVGHRRWICELRDHGRWGIEAQFFRDEEFNHSQRWATREEAIACAEEERRAIEAGGY